jgi:uncharacterized protein with HEPN domain
MESDVQAWLSDIDLSIKEINDFLPPKKEFHTFQSDLKTRKAIERNIEIIGEAMNRILEIHPDILISNSRKIVDTRNRIIHGYDSVSADVLWLIVVRYLPVLQKEINDLLNNK